MNLAKNVAEKVLSRPGNTAMGIISFANSASKPKQDPFTMDNGGALWKSISSMTDPNWVDPTPGPGNPNQEAWRRCSTLVRSTVTGSMWGW